MIAAGALGVFGGRLAAEFAAPDDQRLLEQAALFQILQQAGDRLVGFAGVQVVVGFQVAVGVPVVVVVGTAGVELNEPNAALDQAPGQQALASELVALRIRQTVEFLRRCGLLRRSTASGALRLHLEGQLVAGDPGREVAVVGTRGIVVFVVAAQRVEQTAL